MLRSTFLLTLLFASSTAWAATPTVLVVGDSLSAGYGMPTDKSWTSLLQKKLEDQGYEYRVVNASISGDTTQGGLTRLPRALDKHSPELVIIALGGNDGLRGLPLSKIQENLDTMIRHSLTAGAQVVLAGMRIPPNYGRDYSERFHQIYRELAVEHELMLVPFFLEGIALEEGLFQADRIHPNVAAQAVLLDNVWRAVCPSWPDPQPAQRACPSSE